MILNIIKQTISEYNLIDKNDTVLVGLSGGADSVCLTHALWKLKDELGITLYTAHLNHGIRGPEADRDEKFVLDFSESLGIKCFTKYADIPCEAKKTGESEETAGRKIRYNFFKELCGEYSINKIATAHNRNDNAETLLMNFMRGSSTGGLKGIPYIRENIIRPLLNISREDIEKYCRDNRLEYVTDSTNLSDDYTRNKIRNTFIPLIQKKFNSNFINTVTDNSRLIKEDSEFLEEKAYTAYCDNVTDNSITVEALLNLEKPISRRVIRYMLKDIYQGLNDISAKYVDDILKLLYKNSGVSINLSGEVVARIEYGKLIIERVKIQPQWFSYEINIGDTRIIPELNAEISACEVVERRKDNAIYLTCDDSSRIVIRSRISGDKFYPSGMNGSKKIKEYFIDKKIPRDKRDLIPIIEINERIAAVGDRVDKNFLFKDKGIRIELKKIRR